MELRVLKIFCAVARRGSIASAAQEVSLTPSALSHALRGLEIELGCRLFDREGKRLLLNPAGEELLARVQSPMADLDAAVEVIRNLGKWGQTRLRVGAAATVCEALLPPVVRELRNQHPGLLLHLETGDTPELLDALRLRQIDIALGVTPEPNRELELRPLFADELLAVFPPDHAWAQIKSVTREELRTQPLILYQNKSMTSLVVEAHFQQIGVSPNVIMRVGSVRALKEMVNLGLGVSLLAPWTALRELVRGELKTRPLSTGALQRKWVMAHLASHRLGLAEEKFYQLCRIHAASLAKDRKDLPQRERAA